MSSSQKFTVTYETSGSSHDTIRKTETGLPSYAVSETIAEIKETELQSLKPLYSAIDPDALDQLFQRAGQDESQQSVVISFSYEGYDVTVHSSSIPSVSRKNTAGSDE
jgi:hypothetical protein